MPEDRPYLSPEQRAEWGENGTPVLATYKVSRSAVHETMSFSVYEVPRFHTMQQEQKYPKSLFCNVDTDKGFSEVPGQRSWRKFMRQVLAVL